MHIAFATQTNQSIMDDLKTTPLYLHLSLLGVSLLLFRFEIEPKVALYIGLLGCYLMFAQDEND
jgi:hypothetical protein